MPVRQEIEELLDREITRKYGIPEADRMTRGIHGGILITIGGYSNQFKSMFAQGITSDALDGGDKILYVTGEMSRQQIIDRLASMRAKVNPWFHSLDPSERELYLSAVDRLDKEERLNIVETHSLDQIRALANQKPYDLIIVDYIQVIVADRELRKNEFPEGLVTRELLMLAHQLKTPIIAVSQLNRPKDKDGDVKTSPSLWDFRGSGEIENNSDFAFLVWHPYAFADDEKQAEMKQDGTDKVVKIKLAKNRLLPFKGTIKCVFNPQTCRIGEWTDDEENNPLGGD